MRVGDNDRALRAVARSVTEQVLGGPPFAVGDVVRHPSGRMVKILSGQYWATNGRLSNHWTWREVHPLSMVERENAPLESGYGWRPE